MREHACRGLDMAHVMARKDMGMDHGKGYCRYPVGHGVALECGVSDAVAVGLLIP